MHHAMPNLPGTISSLVINGFITEGEKKLCGEGSFGAVQLATANWPGILRRPKVVAVKSLLRSAENEREKFQREMNIMLMIDRHLNVVQLLGVVPKGSPRTR